MYTILFSLIDIHVHLSPHACQLVYVNSYDLSLLKIGNFHTVLVTNGVFQEREVTHIIFDCKGKFKKKRAVTYGIF